jgi:hypothetical protein
VLDDVLVNFDSGRVRLAAQVLCDFAKSGHQIIMFTCHEHITDIFEQAQADIRVLPHRGEEVDPRPVKRRRKLVAELPPPPPPPILPEPEPVRIEPAVDPNPLLAQAAVEESLFDDLPELPKQEPPPLPPKEKKRKPVPRYKVVPRDWDRDAWPVAFVPTPKPPVMPPPPAPSFEPIEVLAFRCVPDVLPVPEVPLAEPLTEPLNAPAAHLVFASPEPMPPPPKLLISPSQRQRFTWESPEMYREE